MSILNNLESANWNDNVENDGLAIKIFSDYCCNGCSCKTESNHTNP